MIMTPRALRRELSPLSALDGRRYEMRIRLPRSIGALVALVSLLVFLQRSETTAQNQTPAASAKTPAVPVLRTPWGEPDLQGIWTDETDTPLQRSPKYANQDFFTAAEREELDKERSALLRRDKR